MESFGGNRFGCVGFTSRKNRSTLSRRPCSVIKFTQMHAFWPQVAQSSSCEHSKEEFYRARFEGLESENKLKKLKLKLGGVTHTIHTQSATAYAFSGFSIPKSSKCLNAIQHGEQGSPIPTDGIRREDTYGGSFYLNERDVYEPVRKSKRVPKRRVLNMGFVEDGDEGDDASVLKLSSGRQVDDLLHMNSINHGPSRLEKHGRKRSIVETINEDKKFVVEEKPPFSDAPGYENEKLGSVGSNASVTITRNHALQTTKDVIEFPNGLPSPPKKKKSKLSEVEQQLKKAKAAQRRKLQSEKAAKEAEAEAIRKILGHDSVRKKAEKMQKQRDGRASKMNTLGSNTVRCVIGPSRTVVVFSDGLPDIFTSIPRRYPPPREKCAGPNCTNAYKYRDSKSKLPLCSLSCYKAIHGKMQPLIC